MKLSRLLAVLVVAGFVASTQTANAGLVDLTTNAIVVQYQPGDTTGYATEQSLMQGIVANYDYGAWDTGIGITSSTASNQNLNGNSSASYGIGIMNSADLGLSPGYNPTAGLGWLDNINIPSPGAIIMRYTYLGDANLDGVVDTGTDLAAWQQGWNTSNGGGTIPLSQLWLNGGFSYPTDGVITTGNDLAAWQGAWKAPQLADPSIVTVLSSLTITGVTDGSVIHTSSVSVVPEPSSLALLLCVAAIGSCFVICVKKFGVSQVRVSKVGVSVAVVISSLLFGSVAKAELMYSLAPINDAGGNVTVSGSYLGGDTTNANPFSITVKNPTAGQTLSFELIASIKSSDTNAANDGLWTGALDIVSKNVNGATATGFAAVTGGVTFAQPAAGFDYGGTVGTNVDSQNSLSGIGGAISGNSIPDASGPQIRINSSTNAVWGNGQASASPNNTSPTTVANHTVPTAGQNWSDIDIGTVSFAFGSNVTSGTWALSTEQWQYTASTGSPDQWYVDNSGTAVTYRRNATASGSNLIFNGPAITIAATMGSTPTQSYATLGTPSYTTPFIGNGTSATTGNPPTGAGAATNNTQTITTSVTNTSTGANQEALNWWGVTPSTPSIGSVASSNSGGQTLAVGSTSPTVTFTYTPTASKFGFDQFTLTSSGSGNTLGALGGSSTVSLNVLGIGSKGGYADGSGTAGSSYGTALQTASLTAGISLAGLQTSLNTSVSYGIGATTATILAGSNAGGVISMAWRSRSGTEVPGALHVGPLLFSDVVNLTGVTPMNGSGTSTSTPGTNTADTFVMQMSYDNTQGLPGGEGAAASNGFIYLGFRSATNGQWYRATSTAVADGNTANGSNVYGGGTAPFITAPDGGTPGSWAAFTAYENAANPGYTLASLLGSYGVDTADHVTWSVVDHDAEFAVVPEPGTLALLAAGAVALGLAYRRRKAAKV